MSNKLILLNGHGSNVGKFEIHLNSISQTNNIIAVLQDKELAEDVVKSYNEFQKKKSKQNLMNSFIRKNIAKDAKLLIKTHEKNYNSLSTGKKEKIMDKYVEKLCKEKGFPIQDFYNANGKYADLKHIVVNGLTLTVDKFENYQEYVVEFVDHKLTQRERDFLWADYMVERITGNKNIPHITPITDFQKPKKNDKGFKYYVEKPSTEYRFQGIYFHFRNVPEFKKRFEEWAIRKLIFSKLGAIPTGKFNNQ